MHELNQKRRIDAIIGATINILFFVVVPFMLPAYIPPIMYTLLSQTEIGLQDVLNQIMILGAISAALTLMRGFVSKTSIMSLIGSMAQHGTSLFFTAMLLGVGDLGSLGLTYFTLNIENTASQVTINLRVFIYFTVFTVLLRVLEAYLEWNEAGIEVVHQRKTLPQP